MPRFQVALQPVPEKLQDLAGAIQQAQREIFDEGGGTMTVREDPAAKVLMHALAIRLNCQEIDMKDGVYSGFAELNATNAQNPSAGDPSPSRHQDAISAQNGAGNIGALCGTIAKHAKALQDAGIDPDKDPAIRMIGHQVAGITSLHFASDQDVDAWRHSCRAVVAADQARSVLDEFSNNGASSRASP